MFKSNTSGFKGVSWHKREKKYIAGIIFKGKRVHLGYFHSAEAASAAYSSAARQQRGEFVRAA